MILKRMVCLGCFPLPDLNFKIELYRSPLKGLWGAIFNIYEHLLKTRKHALGKRILRIIHLHVGHDGNDGQQGGERQWTTPQPATASNFP